MRWNSRSRRRAGIVMAMLMAIPLAACGSSSSSDDDTISIGIVEIAKSGVLDDTVKAFQDRLVDEMAPTKIDFDIKNANGDQSLIASISRDFAGSDKDAFAVIGTPAVTALAQQVTDRPIFAIAMGDPVGAKVASSLDEPGGNVTGSIDYVEPSELLDVLERSSPKPATVGTIYDPSNQNMAVWSKDLKTAAAAKGLKIIPATTSSAGDVPTAARSLNGRVDTILIGPDATALSAIDAIGATATSAKVPLYVVGGDTSVAGVAGSIGPDYPSLGTLAADAAATVLKGTSAATVPFGIPDKVKTTVNQKTLDALGVTLAGSQR